MDYTQFRTAMIIVSVVVTVMVLVVFCHLYFYCRKSSRQKKKAQEEKQQERETHGGRQGDQNYFSSSNGMVASGPPPLSGGTTQLRFHGAVPIGYEQKQQQQTTSTTLPPNPPSSTTFPPLHHQKSVSTLPNPKRRQPKSNQFDDLDLPPHPIPTTIPRPRISVDNKVAKTHEKRGMNGRQQTNSSNKNMNNPYAQSPPHVVVGGFLTNTRHGVDHPSYSSLHHKNKSSRDLQLPGISSSGGGVVHRIEEETEDELSLSQSGSSSVVVLDEGGRSRHLLHGVMENDVGAGAKDDDNGGGRRRNYSYLEITEHFEYPAEVTIVNNDSKPKSLTGRKRRQSKPFPNAASNESWYQRSMASTSPAAAAAAAAGAHQHLQQRSSAVFNDGGSKASSPLGGGGGGGGGGVVADSDDVMTAQSTARTTPYSSILTDLNLHNNLNNNMNMSRSSLSTTSRDSSITYTRYPFRRRSSLNVKDDPVNFHIDQTFTPPAQQQHPAAERGESIGTDSQSLDTMSTSTSTDETTFYSEETQAKRLRGDTNYSEETQTNFDNNKTNSKYQHKQISHSQQDTLPQAAARHGQHRETIDSASLSYISYNENQMYANEPQPPRLIRPRKMGTFDSATTTGTYTSNKLLPDYSIMEYDDHILLNTHARYTASTNSDSSYS